MFPRARARVVFTAVLATALFCLEGHPVAEAGGSQPAKAGRKTGKEIDKAAIATKLEEQRARRQRDQPEYRPTLPLEASPEPQVQFPRAGELADALLRLDRSILDTLALAEQHGKGWQQLARATGLYMQRARLSGSYDDYANAEAALERAFLRAPVGSGPFEARARLNFSLHRLPQVDEDLAKMGRRVLQDNEYKSRLIGLTADVAFQRGQYAEARAGFERALELDREFPGLCRLAHYHWKTGSYDQAEQLYAEAESLLLARTGSSMAWLQLQRGLMDLDRGRYLEAMAHYHDADRALPSYWLVEEHKAEILTLLGQQDAALRVYHDIIARTDNPEFMDAVAGILQERGDVAGARAMIARARAAYEDQLARYPEAAYGHALGHFLEFGDDPARTLELAEANHALRPGAEAKDALAQAYLGAGRAGDAQRVIEEALATPYVSADLHMTASEVYRARGDSQRAQQQRARALTINPRAAE